MGITDQKMRISVIDRVAKPLNNIRKELKKTTIDVKGMQNSMGKASHNIAVFSKKMSKRSRQLGRIGSSFNRNVTAPVLGASAAIFMYGKNFQKSMNRIQAKTQATGEEMKKLEFLARDLGSKTQFSAKEAADGMGFLAQAGWSVNEILKGTPALLNLAGAAEMDLARAADIASNVMGAFKIEAKDAGHVADVFATATALANIDMEMLGESMAKAAPVASDFKLSLEETTAAIAMLGNIGIQGSESGTSLRRMMINLAAPASKARTILNGLGIEVADSDGKLKSLTTIMGSLGKGMEKLTDKQKIQVLSEVFGARAITSGSELTKVTEQMGEMAERLKRVKGTAEEMNKTLNQGSVGSYNNMVSSFGEMMLALGESGVMEFISSTMKSVTSFFRYMSKEQKPLLEFMVKFAGYAAIIGPSILVISKVFGVVATVAGIVSKIIGSKMFIGIFLKLSSIGVKLIPIFKAIGAVIAGVSLPVWGVVAAVTAAVAAITNLVLRWDKIKKGFSKGLWEGTKTFFGFGSGDNASPQAPKTSSTDIQNALKINSQNNHSLDLNVSMGNLPMGSGVTAKPSKGLSLGINNGMMGATY